MISGIEALGVAAGAAQIAAYIFQLILTIDELWTQLQEAPLRIKVHSEQLSFLKSILQSVENDGTLQNPRAQRHLGKIQDRIHSLLQILGKNTPQPNGGPVRKAFRAVVAFKLEKEALHCFRALEGDKTNLLLYIAVQGPHDNPGRFKMPPSTEDVLKRDERYKTESQEKQIAKRDEDTPMQDFSDHHDASSLGDDSPRIWDQDASASTSPYKIANQAESNEVHGHDHNVNNGIQSGTSGTEPSMSNWTRGNKVSGTPGGNTVNNGVINRAEHHSLETNLT